MNDLEMYREQLALCDDKIIDALVERNKIVEKIMAYKEEYGMPILQPQQGGKAEGPPEGKTGGQQIQGRDIRRVPPDQPQQQADPGAQAV